MIYNIKGKALDLSSPTIMAIINLTNDSFFKQSRINKEKSILEKIETFVNEGAQIIDIGAVSSRPFADSVSQEEELLKILPVVKSIKSHFSGLFLSIDTCRAEVAKQSIELGADMINDISAGNDASMFSLMADNPNIPYIMMHMQGVPQTMQIEPKYDDLILDILSFFKIRIRKLNQLNFHQIILDPGIGFGKTINHNFSIIKHLKTFELFDLPILLGISRKSMIYKTLDTTPEKALNGTSSMHMLGLLNGARILRVHDVKEAKECIKLYENYISVS